MKKVLFTIFLSLIFLISINVNAKTEFKASTVNAKVGDDVKIKVTKSDNEQFQMLGIKIKYDKNKLEFKKCKVYGFDKAFMSGCKNINSIITFYAISASSDDLMNDSGNIYDITFKVKDVTDASIPINLKVTDYNSDIEHSLDYDTIDGAIILKDNTNNKDIVVNNNSNNIKENTSNEKRDNNSYNEVDSREIKEDNEVINNKETSKVKENKKNNIINKTNKFIYIIICFIILFILLILLIKKKKKSKVRKNSLK